MSAVNVIRPAIEREEDVSTLMLTDPYNQI